MASGGFSDGANDVMPRDMMLSDFLCWRCGKRHQLTASQALGEAWQTQTPCSGTRPFAARARELCPESDEHHLRVWSCMTCQMLERRMMPISDVLADALDDADLSITVDWDAH